MMDEMMKEKRKKSLISKTWERCKSIGRSRKISDGSSKMVVGALMTKSKSCPNCLMTDTKQLHGSDEGESRRNNSGQLAPQGCFSVYVGPQRQRFVIKTRYANHPLFKMLLEEAESEYGYNSQGPLVLPCNVDIFYRVLMEMEMDDDDGSGPDHVRIRHLVGCAFAKRHINMSYHLLSPHRMVAIANQF